MNNAVNIIIYVGKQVVGETRREVDWKTKKVKIGTFEFHLKLMGAGHHSVFASLEQWEMIFDLSTVQPL